MEAAKLVECKFRWISLTIYKYQTFCIDADLIYGEIFENR